MGGEGVRGSVKSALEDLRDVPEAVVAVVDVELTEKAEKSDPTEESLSCDMESASRVCPRLVGELGAVGTNSRHFMLQSAQPQSSLQSATDGLPRLPWRARTLQDAHDGAHTARVLERADRG